VSVTGEAAGNDDRRIDWLRFPSWTTCTRPSSLSSSWRSSSCCGSASTRRRT